jgi:sulfite exporter TauE/SafE
MDLSAVNSPSTAFVAGLITSLHCVGMCGPLACSLMPGPGDRTNGHTVSSVYHLTRLTSYAAVGALGGALGRTPLAWVTNNSVLRWVPWIMVLFFIGLAFRWDRYFPKPASLGGITLRLNLWLRGRSRIKAAAALGLATPLLPCGPLYVILALALLSGSAVQGIEFMLAFGLGTVPLLWLAQSQYLWLRTHLSDIWLARIRITLALASAVVIAWRLRSTLGFAGIDAGGSCCH